MSTQATKLDLSTKTGEAATTCRPLEVAEGSYVFIAIEGEDGHHGLHRFLIRDGSLLLRDALGGVLRDTLKEKLKEAGIADSDTAAIEWWASNVSYEQTHTRTQGHIFTVGSELKIFAARVGEVSLGRIVGITVYEA